MEAPCRAVQPPSWDLLKILEFLRSPLFEPIAKASLRDLTRKTLFLVALAMAKRFGELQALSRVVSFSSSSAGFAYVPEFLAKTETAVHPLPRTFEVKSLDDFAAGLSEDLLLCLLRSLSAYVARTSQFVNRPRRLFVSPRCPSRAMSKNGISFYYRRSLCSLVPVLRMWRLQEPIVSVALPLPQLFSATGPCVASLRQPLGALILYLHHFICVIYNLCFREFALWARLSLLVNASGSLHLFLICSRGGGSAILVPFP